MCFLGSADLRDDSSARPVGKFDCCMADAPAPPAGAGAPVDRSVGGQAAMCGGSADANAVGSLEEAVGDGG